MRPPKLLLLATSLDRGGAEHVLLRLAERLGASYRVEAATLLPGGPVASELARLGLPVHELGVPSKLRAPLGALRLRALLRRGGFDIVQSFLFHANMAARMAALLLPRSRRPRVVTSVRIAERARPHRQLLERATGSLSARVVCVSRHVLRALRAEGDPRYLVIPNGVPIPPRAARLAPGAPWLSVGRLFPQKGHDVLIDAWRRLGPDAPRLRIAGRGPLEANLRRAAAPGLPVDLLGERDDVGDLLLESGGFVLASRDEGLPNAVLEAMAAKLPVVATAAGGTPEAIRSGQEGLLVPPGDPAAIAEAVRTVLASPGRARSLGEAARRRAEAEFSVDAMARAYDRLYQSILRGEGGATS